MPRRPISPSRPPQPPPPPAMARTLDLARTYAPLAEDLLIVGPSGAGKSRLARLIHAWSGRRGPLVEVAGGELTETLWASALFGHVRGAYTDAASERRGAFARAAHGTLFLDELHHWPRAVQSALLRPLQERRFAPLGAEREVEATCRILFATTTAPAALVAAGRLEADLLYRLPALVLEVAPLCARRAELLPLLEAATGRTLQRLGWEARHFRWAPSALRAVLLHDWPGNVRQLDAAVTRAVAEAGPVPTAPLECTALGLTAPDPAELGLTLSPQERAAVARWAQRAGGGTCQEGAALLGVHRNTFREYLAGPLLEEGAEPDDAHPSDAFGSVFTPLGASASA